MGHRYTKTIDPNRAFIAYQIALPARPLPAPAALPQLDDGAQPLAAGRRQIAGAAVGHRLHGGAHGAHVGQPRVQQAGAPGGPAHVRTAQAHQHAQHADAQVVGRHERPLGGRKPGRRRRPDGEQTGDGRLADADGQPGGQLQVADEADEPDGAPEGRTVRRQAGQGVVVGEQRVELRGEPVAESCG